MASLYISDKAVVDVVPYAARHVLLRLDVGPFALLYLAVYWCIWRWDVNDGWGKVVVLVVLPAVLVCHLLVFLSTQWSVRFMCLVSQWRVASIDQTQVRVVDARLKTCGAACCGGFVLEKCTVLVIVCAAHVPNRKIST